MKKKSQLFVIIQARMNSTRLPGKILLPLCGKTVLENVFARLQKFHKHIVVATTNNGSENFIVDICKDNNIRYYRGEVENVMNRFYNAASAFGAKSGDTIVRICSDCPCIDSDVVQRAIDIYENSQVDYVSNCFPQSYPLGLNVEVFSFDALHISNKYSTSALEREHVTPYIHTFAKHKFVCKNFEAENNYSHIRLTLDQQEDYEMLKELYALLGNSPHFSYEQLLAVLEEHPEILKINARVEQKTLLLEKE